MNKYNDFSNIVHNGIDEILPFIEPDKLLRDNIFDILSKNNDEIKPFAIINLKSIENIYEAELLLFHLTGQDGRIREAVSFVLNEIKGTDIFLNSEKAKNIILNGLLDINPNVVRNIISFIKNNMALQKEIQPLIIEKIFIILDELSKYIKENSPYALNQEKNTKNHARNKLTFNLYWLLCAISILDVNKIPDLDKILTKTAKFLDYTIREKTALILSKMENPPIQLLRELKNDENMYVKNQLL